MSVNIHSKIKDILSELESLIGINQKEELKSALINKGISISDTDTISDMIEKVNNIIIAKGNAQIENVIKGKTFSNDSNNNLVGTYVPPTLETLGGVKYASGNISNVPDSSGLDEFITVNVGFKPYIVKILALYTGPQMSQHYDQGFAIAKSSTGTELNEASVMSMDGTASILFTTSGFNISQHNYNETTFSYEAYGWFN